MFYFSLLFCTATNCWFSRRKLIFLTINLFPAVIYYKKVLFIDTHTCIKKIKKTRLSGIYYYPKLLYRCDISFKQSHKTALPIGYRYMGQLLGGSKLPTWNDNFIYKVDKEDLFERNFLFFLSALASSPTKQRNKITKKKETYL